MQTYWKMLDLEDVPEETIQKLTSLLTVIMTIYAIKLLDC